MKHLVYIFLLAATVLYFKMCSKPTYITGKTEYKNLPFKVEIKSKGAPYIPTGYMPKYKVDALLQNSLDLYNAKLRGQKKDTVTKKVYYSIPLDADTLGILKDYFAAHSFTDTINFKYGKTVVNDTIGRNRILGRSVNFDLLIPEKTITLIEKPKRKYYAGINVGSGIGPGAGVISKDGKSMFTTDLVFDFKGSAFLIGYKRKIGK